MTTRVSKISAKKELGVAKLFDVSKSSKNVRKTMALQKVMTHYQIVQLKNEEAEKNLNGDSIEFLELQESFIDESMNVQDEMKDYVVNVLKLTDDQADAFDEMTLEEQMAFSSKIGAVIMDVDLKKAGEEDKGLKD
ncbi:phage tail tube assembly chaperone [Leuconostoc falkenbergense]|uniref:phage tail tube assembly chaperone n=1 Tax=Leuconostoc falkenbergense TaxID=2766470 RepID=UPI002A7F3EA2|nr:phage tail tube assembly chaperone [Leuconostoc falkenbergense]MDY5164528.1 phage tail tube assembly chaperone [Leuconostoc falkenbergense]